uniref:DNM1B n=1 Tax=Arundo donax TaxID=35708 RepID=A0A0A9FJ03_ARUDO
MGMIRAVMKKSSISDISKGCRFPSASCKMKSINFRQGGGSSGPSFVRLTASISSSSIRFFLTMTTEVFSDKRMDFSLKSEQAAALLGLLRLTCPSPFSTPCTSFVASCDPFSSLLFSVDSSPFFCGFALHLFVPVVTEDRGLFTMSPE